MSIPRDATASNADDAGDQASRHSLARNMLRVTLDDGCADDLEWSADRALRGAVALADALASALADASSAEDLQLVGTDRIGTGADAAFGVALLVDIGRAAMLTASSIRRAERKRECDAEAAGGSP